MVNLVVATTLLLTSSLHCS